MDFQGRLQPGVSATLGLTPHPFHSPGHGREVAQHIRCVRHIAEDAVQSGRVALGQCPVEAFEAVGAGFGEEFPLARLRADDYI